MIETLSAIIFIGSIAVLLILAARKIPALASLPPEPENGGVDEIGRSVWRLKFLSGAEKFLRKSRIIALRIDNFILAALEQVKQETKKLHIPESIFQKRAQTPATGQTPAEASGRENFFRWLKKTITNSVGSRSGKEETNFSRPYVVKNISEKRSPEEKKEIAGFDRKEELELIEEIVKNPHNSAVYKKLGGLYLKAGNYRDAAASFDAAIKLGCNDGEVIGGMEEAKRKI